jgi:hypothetical protein
MRDSAALNRRKFGRADVETAIDLDRITIYNFAGELLGEIKRQFALAGRSGTENDQERLYRSNGHCKGSSFLHQTGDIG